MVNVAEESAGGRRGGGTRGEEATVLLKFLAR